jgi:hypothetical protein
MRALTVDVSQPNSLQADYVPDPSPVLAICSWQAGLAGLITRRVPLQHAVSAFEPNNDDVKVVIDLAETS